MGYRAKYKKLAFHEGPVDQEIYIARIFFISVGVIALTALLLESYWAGLISIDAFGSGFFPLLWQVVIRVWTVWLAWLFTGLNVFLLIVFIYSLIKVWPLREHQKLRVFGLKPTHAHHGAGHGVGTAPAAGHAEPEKNPVILKHWTSIVKKANTGVSENLRSAVLEADALTDLFLRQAGYSGDTMADRLMQLNKDQVKTLDRLWDAHRLRNEIAHTPGYVVNSRDAEKALLAFRDFLKEMNAF